MIDLRPILLLGSVVLLGLADSSRIQRAAASELNDAFKGRDVNKTIARVEAILARNPNLPRLTRGEILALFDNITKADAAKKLQQQPLKSSTEENKSSDKEESLMVVLPFNANSDQNKGLEDLYTRQPVTRIVGYSTTTPTAATSETTTSTERPKRKKKRKNNNRRKPVNQEIRPVYVDEMKTSTSSSSSGNDLQWNPIVGNGERPSVKKQNVNSDNIEVPDYMKDTLDSFQNSNNQVFVTAPTQKPRTTQSTTTAPAQSSSPLPNISIAAQSLTPELKNLLVSLGLLNPDGTQVSSLITTTTTTTTHSPPPLIQYISINPTVDPASYVVFKPLPLANSRGKNRGNNEETLSEDMRHFLARFGLASESESFRSQKSFDSKNQLQKSSTTSTTSTTTTTNKPDSSENDKTVVNATNEESDMPNFNTDILTDDMKDVLENIGLVKKSRRKNKGVIFNPAMRTAGLLNKSQEKEKVDKLLSTIKELHAAEKNKSLSAEEVAEQLQNITASLVDETKEESSSELELVEGEGSEMYEGYEPAEEELLKLQNGFVDDDLKDDFPIETPETDNNGNNSNNELSLGSSSPDPTSKRPNLKDSPNPPDPLSLEELHHFVENSKNEVKRQQPKNTSENTDEVSTTTESSSDSESSTNDDAKSNSESDSSSSDTAAGDSTSDSDDSAPSQDDLIDSFGGDNPPENRPNGLYFLVDWNTFLRVGTDNKTVDLNFSPKVGDPKNFLPVTVP